MVPFNQIGSLQEIHYDFFLQDLYHVLFKIYIYCFFYLYRISTVFYMIYIMFTPLQDLYHVHCDDSVILAKVNSIIGCFIESTIPPSLQIDIPADLAEKIAERKYERSPYIFREAQVW